MGLRDTLTYRVKDFCWDHAPLQELYSISAHYKARWEEFAGDPYAALVGHCNAARRVRRQEVRERRLHEFASFVKRHFDSQAPRSLHGNVFVRSYLESNHADQVRARLRKWTPSKRRELARNLLLLKVPREGERGVLLVQFTPMFPTFLANFCLEEVESRYMIVLEPSRTNFPEPYWALFSCQETPVVAEVITEEAAEAIRQGKLPLIPIPIGAQDWVDPELFRPLPDVQKDFDVVMVATFSPVKRHAVLFRALQELRPRRLRVALVGIAYERTRQEFEAELRQFGVEDDCTIFQGITAPEVNQILNRSKVNVLLTKAEGGNRGLMEGFAANVPCVVYRHIVGPRHSDVNPMTGMLADDDELADVLLEVIGKHDTFRPRDWFLQHSGYKNATAKLNAVLREEALRRGERWMKDIVAFNRRPGSEIYLAGLDAEGTAEVWKELEKSLARL